MIHINFGVICFGSVENVMDILIGIALNMQMALDSLDIFTINFSNPRTQVIFPFLCMIFRILHQCFIVSEYRYLSSVVSLFFGYFILFDVLSNGTISL